MELAEDRAQCLLLVIRDAEPSCYATLCSPLFELNRAGSPKTWGHDFQLFRVSSLPRCYSAVQTSPDTCTIFCIAIIFIIIIIKTLCFPSQITRSRVQMPL
jgi:hypothetical protein